MNGRRWIGLIAAAVAAVALAAPALADEPERAPAQTSLHEDLPPDRPQQGGVWLAGID